jgi:hypothetical protein
MRSGAPPLLPVFRSRHQADLLTVLFLHPDEDHTTTDLATRLGIRLTTAHRELSRLQTAGLLSGRQVGRARLLRANTAHRAFVPLAQLLLVTFGPHVVIGEEFTGLPRVGAVVLYGSWAARYDGVDGPAPADVDVLLVGTPERASAYAAAERAEERLSMPVNPVIRSPARWATDDDPLISTIKAGPHLVLDDGSDESAARAEAAG